jgi:hypothetical protein
MHDLIPVWLIKRPRSGSRREVAGQESGGARLLAWPPPTIEPWDHREGPSFAYASPMCRPCVAYAMETNSMSNVSTLPASG